jgi:hypothetical protein
VAADLRRRGFKIAIPFGEDWNYDLVVERSEDVPLERVQVKYAQNQGSVLAVRCLSHSLTNGRVRATKRYTGAIIDWLAAYDVTTGGVYYIPAHQLGDGRCVLHLRLDPTLNCQAKGIRWARDYLRF